jgi:hypothetical protein
MDAPRRLSIGQLQRALAHPLAQFGLFLGFVIALVAILSGGFQTRDLRLDGSRVGRESPQDIKVSRTFIYTEQDSAATEATRDRVSASVPPVYDWQEGLGEQIGGDLERAFEQQRRAMANALLATSVTPVNPAASPPISAAASCSPPSRPLASSSSPSPRAPNTSTPRSPAGSPTRSSSCSPAAASPSRSSAPPAPSSAMSWAASSSPMWSMIWARALTAIRASTCAACAKSAS